MSEPSTRAPSEAPSRSVSRSASRSASRESSPVATRNITTGLAPIPEESTTEGSTAGQKANVRKDSDKIDGVAEGKLLNEATCPGIDGEELSLSEKKQLPIEEQLKKNLENISGTYMSPGSGCVSKKHSVGYVELVLGCY